MIKTKFLFYEMHMRKTHVIVVYARIRTFHEAKVLSLMASLDETQVAFEEYIEFNHYTQVSCIAIGLLLT